jgi:pimeloyl-ACP methyl ester carboxylesterase
VALPSLWHTDSQYSPACRTRPSGTSGLPTCSTTTRGATLAVLDQAGHALPHEQPELQAGLLQEWLARTGPSV